MSERWIATVEEDDEGNQYIPFTDEQLEAAGWKEGDIIEWKDNGDGSWTLSKKEKEKVWVMVEAVSQFRMRYMVEVDADHPEWALDTVTMNEAKEFSQEHIGETIVSHRVVSESEALAICDIDNDYANGKFGNVWTKEQKMNAFFTRDGEKAE